MSRIDAQVATQVSDFTRPQQTVLDQQAQVAAARRRTSEVRPDDALTLGEDAPKSDDVRAAADHIRQVVEAASGKQLSFTVDDSGKDLVVQVSDAKGIVIRQIPSKEVLELRQRIDELVGAFIDKKA